MNVFSVVVFCGANNHPEYSPLAYLVGKLLAQNGFVTITGGGPGMMGQVNKGALEAGGESVGICIKHPHEKKNPYLTKHELYETFEERHRIMLSRGDAFVVLPGGIGTVVEALEITQLKKFKEKPMNTPLMFVGSYYKNFLGVLSEFDGQGFITESLKELYSYVETPEEMIAQLKK